MRRFVGVDELELELLSFLVGLCFAAPRGFGIRSSLTLRFASSGLSSPASFSSDSTRESMATGVSEAIEEPQQTKEPRAAPGSKDELAVSVLNGEPTSRRLEEYQYR